MHVYIYIYDHGTNTTKLTKHIIYINAIIVVMIIMFIITRQVIQKRTNLPGWKGGNYFY